MENRIREWREARGRSLEDVAFAAGVSASYLSKMERAKRNVSLKSLRRIAAALGVRESDLVADVTPKTSAAPTPSIRIPVMGRVGAGATVSFEDDGAEIAKGDAILFPAGRDIAALVVQGDSQWPRYREGTVILFDRAPLGLEEIVGEYAIVETWGGERLLKIVRRGFGHGKFDLESDNAPPIRDADVKPIGFRIVGELKGRTPSTSIVRAAPPHGKRRRG